MYSIDGYTYNLVNGEVKKERLSKKNIVDEKKMGNLYLRKIAMPNVEVGSIIELEYYKTTGHTNFLPDWYFQQVEYPVLWSEIELTIPNYWEYNVLLQGYEPLVINSAIEVSVPAPFLPARDGTDPIYRASKRHYAVQNIPALREFEHTNSLKNYLTRITFDLVSFLHPFQAYRQNFATNWDKIAETVLDDDEIGQQITKSFMEDNVKELVKGMTTQTHKVEAVLA